MRKTGQIPKDERLLQVQQHVDYQLNKLPLVRRMCQDEASVFDFRRTDAAVGANDFADPSIST